MSTVLKRTIGCTLALVVVVGVLFGALFLLGRIGGVPPSYEAHDHDPMLSQEAALMRPFIVALARYHAEHGQFPPNVSVLGLPSPEEVNYFKFPKGGYSLSRKLGWDPRLVYLFEKGHGRWIFDPGDGSPTKVLIL